MAIIYMTNGEERYIEDALLSGVAFEPLRKRQLRDKIANLRAQLTAFPAMTSAEKIAYAETHSSQYVARDSEGNIVRATQVETDIPEGER